jgi:ribonuclease R
MSKKRNISKRKMRPYSRHKTKNDHYEASKQTPAKDILRFVYNQLEPVTLAEILADIDEDKISKKQAHKLVSSLVTKGDLSIVGKKHFFKAKNDSIFTGIIEKNPRGFGFVTDLQPRQLEKPFVKDPFLSIKRIGTANHGDKVLIRINRVRKDGRPEAEVITILSRFSDRLTGFYKNGSPPRVIPEDPRYPADIRIVNTVTEDIDENTVVIVEILAEQSRDGAVQGKITEILGSVDNVDVQMRMVIEKNNLPHVFPPAVLDEANKLSISTEESASRLDLRKINHVTIDGETAKDFDDAVAVEKTAKGYRLYVSIADVAHFVQQDSALDKEAYLRGTSIYFPGRVIPMLPENLSNNLCSLVPNEDRLTFTAILDFNPAGKLINKKFSKSVICSRQRFTYTIVNAIVMDQDQNSRDTYKDFVAPLDLAKDLATILYSARMNRGSIGFNIPEAEFSLNDEGKITSIERKKRNFAHQIIEEFMLAANEAVASTFSAANHPFIYRIHEKPEEEKVVEFAEFALTMGLELPPTETDPHWFAKVLGLVKGQPAEYVVNNLLLRTMQQARYAAVNTGHFGLAATDYTHFTSPIRRYPDLIVHRLLHRILEKRATKESSDSRNLAEHAEHLSKRERTAVTAERDMADRLKVFFMEQYLGENFQAVISGISEGAIFVELIDLFVSGSIDISLLTDDYYLYDIKRHRFIGEITGKTYQLGAAIGVTLLDVDHRRRRIYFAPTKN